MGIMGVLFNPNGRIQANQFWQGVIVLVGFQIILGVLPLLGLDVPDAAGWITFLLIYPYLCVYGKRLHDSNKSAWMFLAFALLYVVISTVALFFTPGLSDFVTQYMELAQEGDEEALLALADQFENDAANGLAIVGIISVLVSNFLIGFIVARMFSDPHTNQYGPPVGGEAAIEGGDDDVFG